MNKEAYISFETAKLLREKGFPQSTSICNVVYKPNGKMSFNAKSFINPCYLFKDWYIFAPTQQMACRWLRKRGIHIMPTIGCDVDRTPRIFYGAVIALFNDYGDIDYRDPLDENGYNEPEDAIEAALQYCLTNLI